ncbi:MAG: c-type cytochrome, partial [Isosphaeraceae bacterium]
WSDTGECHDHDGVHRVSGRMYKITYGQPRKPISNDIRDLSQADLLNLLTHANEWYARQTRLEIARRLQNQNLAKAEAEKSLKSLFQTTTNPVHQVRAMLALHAAGLAGQNELETWLGHENPHLRTWALRLLTDPSRGVDLSATSAKLLAEKASHEKSAPVRLAYASALRHVPLESRLPIARNLLQASEDAGDHNQPMMIWYGIEPLAEKHQELLVDLFHSAKIPIVRKWIARRITQEYEKNQAVLTKLLKSNSGLSTQASLDLAQGMTEGLSGRRKAEKPDGWDTFAKKANESGDQPLQNEITSLSAFFGDGIAIESIRQIALDSGRDLASRRQALKALIEARSPNLKQDCRSLFLVRDLSTTAAQGLVLFDDAGLADETLNNFSRLYGYERSPVISTLISRPLWAKKILVGVDTGKVRRDEITATMARQIRNFGDSELDLLVSRVWGSLRETTQDRVKQINDWKKSLDSATLAKADLANGRSLFQKNCGSCHKMYGEGGTSGPELTGSGRDNLDYLLQNIFDPSSQVPANYRLSTLALKDGRLLSGVVLSRSPATIAIQTPTDRINIDAGDVDQLRETEQSLMPDGLLQNLKPDEIRDLIGFLMKK